MNPKKLSYFISLLLLFVLICTSMFSAAPAQPTFAAKPAGDTSFLTGPNSGKPLDIALDYLRQNRSSMGLSAADLQDFIVTDQYISDDTGVTHIYFRQRYQGIEIFQANINMNITRDGAVINLGGSFVPDLQAAANTLKPVRSATQAIESAASYLGLKLTSPLVVKSTASDPAQTTLFAANTLSASPIRARLAYYVVNEKQIHLSWNMEIEEASGEHFWNLLVDAQTGEMLGQYDYVVHDNWGGPAMATDDNLAPAKILPNQVVASEPGNNVNAPAVAASYNVFALPKESPSDGPRTLVTPEDATASPFGWHDTNGIAGAEYTYTRGNNAYAYTDLDNNNLPDAGSSPDGGAGLVFNFPLDLNQGPTTYRPAVVTNLFYWNNIVHDVLFHYGFNEPAGNFQSNNYGHGGSGNDPVNAEAQDGSGTNNANFATPSDGSSPRMQMFIWTSPPDLTVTAPAGIAGSYTASGAGFGPGLYNITGNTIVVVDSTAPTSDGCEAIQNNLTGMIALIDRGTCNFTVKVKNAQLKGAIGVIIVNNIPGDPIPMGGTDATVTIPSAMVSDVDGALFKANLPTVHLVRTSSRDRDSDLDAGVISHEYTHGISNRLTGGPSNVNCLSNQEQMGEGWSDFVALALTAVSTDTATTSRGVGTYVSFQPTTGTGIRPTPYTTDLSVNPTTYGDIPGLAVPHGVGYAWASMLWEVYWNMVTQHGYNPDIYGTWNTGGNNLALQLVIEGMKLQPCSPGFVDGRNAILQADQVLTSGANYCAIYAGFAKRGLGYSANQGSTNNVTDGSEAFDMPPSCSPDILAPDDISEVQVPGMTFEKIMSFQNIGADLNWTLSEAVSDCTSPSDIAWVSESPTSGTTGPGMTTQIPVIFNTTGLTSGNTYTGLLCINSNDPAESTIPISLTLQIDFPMFLPNLLH
jgi:extracellular elastinolytic metalloproteinase